MPAGWGKGMTPAAAVLSACGEALERYAASLPDPWRIRRARLADLSRDEAVDPGDFPLYAPEQYERPGFPFVRFDPEVPHPWVEGWRAGTGARAWLPAALVFLTPMLSRRQNICGGTSNGLAAGWGTGDAALRAMLELVERDAVLAAWRTRRPGRAVAIDADWDADLLAVVEGIGVLGGAVEARLLPSACGYPAAICLAFGDGAAWPGVTLGLGVDPDARTALRQAVLELGQTGPYLRRLMRQGAPAPAGPRDVREMMDHAAYYFDPRRASAFDFLRGGAPLRWSELAQGPERSLATLEAALATAGVRMWLADVTPADLALTPFRVVRALSPDLQPITFGFGLDRVSVARIAPHEVPSAEALVSPIW
jgi:ribosomal protein S12 methylthiotransferase accessory factor